jgi:hypothetical protein
MKLCLLTILLAFGLSSLAQSHFTPVDRDKVKKAISDNSAPTAYQKLLGRFNAFDTTLTLEDYRLLYYGYVFQDSYSSNPDEKKKEIGAAINAKNFDYASLLCDSVLSKYPISLAGNFYKGLALFRAHPDDSGYIKYRDRYRKLLDAIFSSGNGQTCETGFRVISVSDEYMIIYTDLKTKQFKGQSLVGHCDLLKIQPSDSWPNEQIYFDATEILKKEADLFK